MSWMSMSPQVGAQVPDTPKDASLIPRRIDENSPSPPRTDGASIMGVL